MGDDVQAIKAGIMEIADIFVINKADLPGADRVERDLRGEVHKPILRTVATQASGVDELVAVAQGVPYGPVPVFRGTTQAGMPVPQFDHLGIPVRSLDEAAAFYEILGLQVS